jgi:phage baseplate assembly protein W
MARSESYVTKTSKEEKRYSDIALGFNVSPVTGNIARVTDEQSVKQALRTLILTNNGERFHQKSLGTNLNSMLFDMIDPVTSNMIRNSIEESIGNFEPRVDLIQVQVIPDEIRQEYRVNIFFRIINIPEIQQLDLTLKRVR